MGMEEVGRTGLKNEKRDRREKLSSSRQRCAHTRSADRRQTSKKYVRVKQEIRGTRDGWVVSRLMDEYDASCVSA